MYRVGYIYKKCCIIITAVSFRIDNSMDKALWETKTCRIFLDLETKTMKIGIYRIK